MLTVQVIISEDCCLSQEAKCIVAQVAADFPEVSFELVDIDQGGSPAEVFAVPTYLLNGKVVFLGNPTPRELGEKLDTLLRR